MGGQTGHKLTRIDVARDIVAREGWLSQTSPEFRKAMLDRASLQCFASGETIYMVGAPPGGIYGIVSGGLRLSATAGDSGPFFTHYFRRGSWIGEGPVIAESHRAIGLSAATDTELLHVPLPGLREILNREPSFWRWVALLAFEHECTAVSAMADLMIRDHVKRFIAVLLRLGDVRTSSPDGNAPIEVNASQSDLAAIANVARTTANMILRRLATDRKVTITYGKIYIMKADALRSMLAE